MPMRETHNDLIISNSGKVWFKKACIYIYIIYFTKNQNWCKNFLFSWFSNPSKADLKSFLLEKKQATHATTCLPRVAAFTNGRWNTFSHLKVKHHQPLKWNPFFSGEMCFKTRISHSTKKCVVRNLLPNFLEVLFFFRISLPQKKW